MMANFDARRAAAEGAAGRTEAGAVVDTGAPAPGAVQAAQPDPSGPSRPQSRPPGAIVIDLGSNREPSVVEIRARVEY